MQYLIRQLDDDEFDISVSDYPLVLRPKSFESTLVEPSGYEILVENCLISFSPEPPGLQISFSGGLSAKDADLIVNEILENLEEVTGNKGKVIRL